MELKEILSNLCMKDKRSPYYDDLYGWGEDEPTPRKDCFCDNCFRGLDKLALEILKLKGE